MERSIDRNFSMPEYWRRMAEEWSPECSFSGSTKAEWAIWQRDASATLRTLLGRFPEPVELNPTVEYTVATDGLIRERVVFDTEKHMSVPAILLKPAEMKSDGTNPAILCCHGHGHYGKDPVAGIRSSDSHVLDIENMNYNYGEQLARAGFLTFCPDLRGFGERGGKQPCSPGLSQCDVNYVQGSLIGLWTLTLNIWDMQKCIDYMETRPEVDPARIGMVGLSQGGTMTTFTAAVEPRIKAADVSGYVSPWKDFALRRPAVCGAQVLPSIYQYFDTSDIAGLIAPRPLLLEMGVDDSCFFIEELLEGYRGVQRIYDAAGAQEMLWADVHPGRHAFAGNKAFPFFKEFL